VLAKIEHSVDPSCILEEYHEFADVFSKAKADTLALHQPYHLKINLEEDSNPPLAYPFGKEPNQKKYLSATVQLLERNATQSFDICLTCG